MIVLLVMAQASKWLDMRMEIDLSNYKENIDGFLLIELMVVIAITAIIL